MKHYSTSTSKAYIWAPETVKPIVRPISEPVFKIYADFPGEYVRGKQSACKKAKVYNILDWSFENKSRLKTFMQSEFLNLQW